MQLNLLKTLASSWAGISSLTSSQFLRYTAAIVATLLGADGNTSAVAQSIPEETTVRLKYVSYKDFQSGGENRMTAKSPMLWFDAPLGDSWEVEGSGVLDSLSGASPYYLDSLSGASGTGIHDKRKAADLKFTKYFENFSVGAGAAWSNENDYRSKSASVEARLWNEDKTTVLAAGVSNDWDDITSTTNPEVDEFRRTTNFFVGVTQVINPVSILQSNLTFGHGKGYFIDPYKLFDTRPRTREQLAWLNRYVLFIRDTEGSLHTDYRLYGSSWGTLSHTFGLAYYQPLGEKFTLRPAFRYYLQSKADFFSADVPPLSFDTFNSSDQRLAGFGSYTAGLKLIFHATKTLEFDALYDYMRQSDALNPSAGDDRTKDLGAHYFEIGVTKRF